ncbi:hypothetical protein PENSOL_c018G11499 [Penicillium solitum]|uniref:Uncharacterized protein n=1 Tax=Penicillium solitum TaxID=60172 RepID=A0A1V6R2Z4_9EURO|nr:uncharacterized protein PENSOL_c018G11499 [Penicillium solitum]OQD95858.1 hypothetical protein PENSOL_c018G11499 [Penicillium solitum]
MAEANSVRRAESGITLASLETWTEVTFSLANIGRKYDPSGTVSCMDVFCDPLRGVAAWREEYRYTQLNRWEEFVSNDLNFHEVDGHHYTMFSPDRVPKFQQKLKKSFTTPYSIKSHIVRLHSSAASTFEAITTETIVIVTIDVDRPGHPHKQPQTSFHPTIRYPRGRHLSIRRTSHFEMLSTTSFAGPKLSELVSTLIPKSNFASWSTTLKYALGTWGSSFLRDPYR